MIGKLLTLATATFAVAPIIFSAAQAGEADDAAKASDKFYAAISVLDDGAAMSTVFAQAPYVTFVGPRSMDIIVGWPKLKLYFEKSNALFKSRKTQISERHIHVSGNLAWEVGLETGENEMADGSKIPVNWVVTNVLEKQPSGTWLMVSHHVQPGSK